MDPENRLLLPYNIQKRTNPVHQQRYKYNDTSVPAFRETLGLRLFHIPIFLKKSR